MIRSPIHKALLIFLNSNARFLLMGGQACILYGAAEFSRDLDLSVAVDAANLEAVKRALKDLKAEPVFFPEMNEEVLQRGHACHFRCHLDETEGLRIDIMSRMRGCDDFDVLWERREWIEIPEVGQVNLLSLPDLVRAKKTQREKDWPMIRRLIETDYFRSGETVEQSKIVFWFRECRTPEILVQLTVRHLEIWKEQIKYRPLLASVNQEDPSVLVRLLMEEELHEMIVDREYWKPLKQELERWRRERQFQ